MDNLKIITIVGSVLAFIITYLDKREEKFNNLKQEYFDKVLCVYYNKYRKNSQVSSIDFIKWYFKDNEVFIPKYVFYLCDDKYKDESNEERLSKVLLVDYWKQYPNKANMFYGGMNSIFDKGYVLVFFTSVFVLLSGAMLLAIFVMQLILAVVTVLEGSLPFSKIIVELNANDAWIGLIYGILALILEVIFHRCTSKEFYNSDDYSLNVKIICKIIKKKVKLYNKVNSKYYV